MRELELDGIHDDGEHAVLIDSDGERYTVRIDEALRAAVRRDRPALGMIQAAGSAPLRPREIQAMLRAGRSAEEISEIAQVSVEHVRRYEGPVLAEREWTAQRARTFPVGRGGPSLSSVVSERLAARQADEDVAWDAWRRTDGTWTLELSFSAGGRTRQAHWVADIDNRSVSPVDDEARWISDEDGPPEPVRGRARLQAVKTSVYDHEAAHAFEEGATGRSSARGATAPGPAVDEDELDALNARRGLRSVTPPEDDGGVWSTLDEDPEGAGLAPTQAFPVLTEEDLEDASVQLDDSADAGSEDGSVTTDEDADSEAARDHARGGSAPSAEQEEPEAEEEDPAASPSPTPTDYQDTVDLTPLPGFDRPLGSSDPEEPAEPAAESRPANSRGSSSKAKSKRASMPSWDEIVFGSKQD